MLSLTRAIHERLSADATVLDVVTRFQGEPAVFTGRNVPASAKLPFVHVRPALADEPMDTLKRHGRDITQDIALYATESGSEARVESVADHIRRIFHRRPLDVEGHATVDVAASGPVDTPDEPHVTGRIVSLRVRLQELN